MASEMYEAAAEIADAIRRLPQAMAMELFGGTSRQLSASSTRDDWAIQLFCSLLKEEGTLRFDSQSPKRQTVAQLARQAWQLADALDDADPLADTADLPASAAGDQGGIDLSPGALDDC
jgi:hypothetical protein